LENRDFRKSLPLPSPPRFHPLSLGETRLYHVRFNFSQKSTLVGRSKGEIISKHKWKFAGFTALLLALALWWIGSEIRHQGFSWDLFFSVAYTLEWRWLALACVLVLATYLGRALRWAVLIRSVRPQPSLRNLFSATVIGFTAITLLGRPGELIRPYLIAVKENVPFSSQLAAWFLERIYDLLITLLVAGFALSHIRSTHAALGPTLGWLLASGGEFLAAACVLCLVAMLLVTRFAETVRSRLLEALGFLPESYFARAERLVNAFVQGAETAGTLRGVLLLTGYTVLEWILIAMCYLCVTKAFGQVLRFNLADMLIYMGFVALGAIVQIPGIGGGVQVVSVLVLRKLFGLPLEIATSVALLIWLITFVVVVPAGLLFALYEGLNWSALRAIRREVAT